MSKFDPGFGKYKRVKTPTILQMEAIECGAASLAIVLGYYGRVVPLEALRVDCGVSRDGSKASNILKAARAYGLTAKGYKKDPAALSTLPLPAIIHWNFNHFLVLEGFGRRNVYLNDPASGPRRVSREEFDHAFTGVVLLFQPGPDFEPGGQRPSLISSLQKRLATSAPALSYVVLAGLGLLAPGLIGPALMRVFVDYILVRQLSSWLGPLLLGMTVAALLRAALTWLQQHYLLRLETRLSLSASSQFLWHTLHLPIEFFTHRFGGEIGARVRLNDRLAQLLSRELVTTVLNAVLVIFYAAIMLHYSVALTLLGISIALLNLVALSAISRHRQDGSQRWLQERGKLVGLSLDGLQIIETLKATGAESNFFAHWAGQQAKTLNAEQTLNTASHLLGVTPPFLSTINTAFILWVGGRLVLDNTLTMGTLVAFQYLMSNFITPVNRLVNFGATLQQISGDIPRLNDVLNHPRDPQADSDNGGPQRKLVKLSGCVKLENITFGYNRLAPPLIANFSLDLEPGSRVALVGGSGSGKSTIIRLVAGLYQPWSGQILFDGQPREHWPRSLMTNSLALVNQDIFLFEGTGRENLTLWDKTAPETSIIRAAKDAHIHRNLADRPGGYEYLVQENGRNFSGGERQRLEIARALAVEPTILLLDEATSALDPITEKIIDDNIRRRGCTCLIVAHRLSTIRDCDEIIVLEQGRVVQRGTHQKLSQHDGPYTRLLQDDTTVNRASMESMLEFVY